MTDAMTVTRTELGPLQRLAAGGTAVLYRAPAFAIPGIPGVVYKEYKQPVRARAGPALLSGLLTFVRFREKLAAEQLRLWDERVVWPLRVVLSDSGAAAGVVMRLIPPRYFQQVRARSGSLSIKVREVETLFGRPGDVTRLGFPDIDLRVRLRVIAKIASSYAMMHRAGVVVGDVSGRNVVYDVAGDRPSVLVVDADSARVEGGRSAFGSQPHTPYWEPPEALRAARRLAAVQRQVTAPSVGDVSSLTNTTMVQNKATDLYKFGLMVVRILDYGRGRALNRDPARAAQALRSTLGREAADLLARTMADDPAERPSMRDWYEVTHPGSRRPAEPNSSTPVTARPAPVAAGTVSGSWVYVDGTGWVRQRSAGGGR